MPGGVRFNLERMNEPGVSFVEGPPSLRGVRAVNVTDAVHPQVGGRRPAGHVIGYEHTIVREVKNLPDGIKA